MQYEVNLVWVDRPVSSIGVYDSPRIVYEFHRLYGEREVAYAAVLSFRRKGHVEGVFYVCCIERHTIAPSNVILERNSHTFATFQGRWVASSQLGLYDVVSVAGLHFPCALTPFSSGVIQRPHVQGVIDKRPHLLRRIGLHEHGIPIPYGLTDCIFQGIGSDAVAIWIRIGPCGRQNLFELCFVDVQVFDVVPPTGWIVAVNVASHQFEQPWVVNLRYRWIMHPLFLPCP